MYGVIVVSLLIGYIIGAILENRRDRQEIQELRRTRSISTDKLTDAYEQIEQLKQDNIKLSKKLKSITCDNTN